ncbi:MAG TPA: STAS-like domain-containing protein [Phycisphaerae bacterium]|nr:STAS-like domain-containing protein [Phycisphaerae bacterium]
MRMKLVEITDAFVTRLRGEQARIALLGRLGELNEGDVLEVDFEGVGHMTPSFADECFGKLAVDVGRETIGTRLRLINANAPVRAVVNTVITNRLAQHARTTPTAQQ